MTKMLIILEDLCDYWNEINTFANNELILTIPISFMFIVQLFPQNKFLLLKRVCH